MTQDQENKPSKLCWIALAAILVLAAVLRIYGLRWGLPNDLHAYSYHPDEFLTVGSSARVAGLVDGHRTLNPGLYNYPSLYLYLSALSMMVGNGYGLLGGPQSAYLAARIITVLMGIGAVGATYWAGRVMFGTTAGILAAFILAIAPIHVQHSHFATVDVPSTLFVALCLGFAALIYKRGSWRDYIFAGVMAGLAGGTKYNAVLIIFAPMAAHIIRTTQPSILSSVEGRGQLSTISRLRNALSPKLWLIPACAIAAFIISTPGSLLYTSQFLHGITYEMSHAKAGHGLVFSGTGNGFIYTLTSSLWYGISPLFAFLFLAAFICGIYKKDRRIWILLAFIVPYYALISISQVRFARYAMALLPAVAIMLVWLMSYVYQCLRKPGCVLSVGRIVWIYMCVGAVLSCFSCAMIFNTSFVWPSPQDGAAKWIFDHARKGDVVGVLDTPWFYSPPLSRNFGGTLEMRKNAVASAPYRIMVFSDYGEPGEWLSEKESPKWIVISDFETSDALRLRNNADIEPSERMQVDNINENLKVVNQYYNKAAIFGSGYDFLDIGMPPHDMRYSASVITIYRRK